MGTSTCVCEIEIEIDCIKKKYLTRTALLQFLADAGLYESHEEAIKREEVLGRLDQVVVIFELRILSLLQLSLITDFGVKQIVKTWVKNVCRAKGFNDDLVHEANAKIFTFGSYRLGVCLSFFLFTPLLDSTGSI